jgi:hypothetical protein
MVQQAMLPAACVGNQLRIRPFQLIWLQNQLSFELIPDKLS